MPTIPLAHIDAASTLAVVVSSHEPLLFLSADQTVIAGSASFCRAFGIDPATLPGRRLSDLGNGEWAMPKLASLLKATAAGSAQIDAYEIDLTRPDQKTRNLVVHARRLDDGIMDQIRLLLAVTDVTDARADARHKEDLVREKAVFLQEVQHRVANSLQIIASVLMQSARKVQSDEVRGHLHNAHHRVMSIAAVQKQLSTSLGGSVDLRIYLTQLCESLSASMIADPDRLSISVSVDDSAVGADVSISLGLIVTELVINALKHAFPPEALSWLDRRKRPRLCENSDQHGLRRNDVLQHARVQYFVPMQIVVGGFPRKLFSSETRYWSFHTASAHTCRSAWFACGDVASPIRPFVPAAVFSV